jgi:hypothetical protein
MTALLPPNPAIVNRSYQSPIPTRAKIVSVQPTGDEGTGIYVTFDTPVFLTEKLTDEGLTIPEFIVDNSADGVCYDQPDPLTLEITYPMETASKTWSINTQPDTLKTLIYLPDSGYVETLA